MKRKKKLIVVCFVLLVVTIAAVYIGMNRRSAPSFALRAADLDEYRFGSVPDLNVSLGDNGLYYSDGTLLKYYDMEKRQSYVLCGKANCTHLTESCCAFFPAGILGDELRGIAQVGNYVYCFYQDSEGVSLYSLDLTDWSRDVVVCFPCKRNVTENDSDEFYPIWANAVTSVQYCDGYAWISLQLAQIGGDEKCFTQLMGINLKTGEVIRLNGEYSGSEFSFDRIFHGSVYFKQISDTEEMISEKDFYEQYGDKPATINGMVFQSWNEYWRWFSTYIPREEHIYQYDVENRTTTLSWSGLSVQTDYGQLAPVQVLGEYQGDVLWCEYLPDESLMDGFYDFYHRRHYLRDTETGTDQFLFEVENGTTYALAQGYDRSRVLSDGTILYQEYTGEETMDIYLFDLNTMESRFLFTDDRHGTFRIFGEYNGGFFGKHKDHQDDMRFYWISREDFYAGNLDAAIMYQL